MEADRCTCIPSTSGYLVPGIQKADAVRTLTAVVQPVAPFTPLLSCDSEAPVILPKSWTSSQEYWGAFTAVRTEKLQLISIRRLEDEIMKNEHTTTLFMCQLQQYE